MMRVVLFCHLPPWEQRRANSQYQVLAIFRVFCWGFADTMMIVIATVWCPATTSGADAT